MRDCTKEEYDAAIAAAGGLANLQPLRSWLVIGGKLVQHQGVVGEEGTLVRHKMIKGRMVDDYKFLPFGDHGDHSFTEWFSMVKGYREGKPVAQIEVHNGVSTYRVA